MLKNNRCADEDKITKNTILENDEIQKNYLDVRVQLIQDIEGNHIFNPPDRREQGRP